jgi:hypothetical protein
MPEANFATIEHIKNELLDAIRLHPQHECRAEQRRTLYQSFGKKPVLQWLEIVTARKVIPIYEA